MKDFFLYNWPVIAIGLLLIYLVVEYVKYRRGKEISSTDIHAMSKQPLPETLVLSRISSQLSSKQLQNLSIAIVILAVVMIIIAALLIVTNASNSFVQQLLLKIQEEPEQLFNLLLMPVMLIVLPLLSLAVMRNERLILTKDGMSYHSPFKGILSNLHPGWQLSWSEIESISLGNRLVRGQLIIKLRDGKMRRLIAHVWRRENNDIRRKFKSIFARLEYERELQQYSLLALEQLPLLRYIQEVIGISIETQSQKGLGFDLAKNSSTRLLLFILFGVMLYAIIDFVANDETYVSEAPVFWFVVGGIVVTVMTVKWLSGKDIPKSNVWGLSLMLGIISAIALYPGLLRINQMTDNEGLIPYEYRKVADYQFKPGMDALPIIVMPADEYWLSLEMDSVIYFKLRQGALGFYQIDMAPEYTKMRMWYCRKYAKDDPEKLGKCDDSRPVRVGI